MAVIYAAAVRTDRMDVVQAAIDQAATAGKLRIGTAAMGTVLATIDLADPCGSVSGDVLTFTAPRSDTSADNTGTAAAATISDGDDNVIVSGLTVGLAATNIIITTTSINAGDTVTMTAGSLTHNTSGS